jgi:outer membrane protein assembly factor BamB
LAACLLAALTACGGGGGGAATESGSGGSSGQGGSGAGTQSALSIKGYVYSFVGGAAAPGPIAGGANTLARIQVTEVANGGAIVTGATVTLNGTSLAYVASQYDYEGTLNVGVGSTITLSVQLDGTTYSGSVNTRSGLPTITVPSTGTVWDGIAAGAVSWSAAGSSTPNAIGVFGPGGTQLWPTGGTPMAISAQQGNVSVPTGGLGSGTVWVAVGTTTTMTVTPAAAGSSVAVGTFSYDPVTVDPMVHSLVGISVAPNLRSVYLGKSLQLVATGNYGGGILRDVTSYATWNSPNTKNFTVDLNGLATAVGPGTTAISAQYAGFSASDPVTTFVPNPSPAAPLSQSVNYQIDAAHSGRVTFGTTAATFPPLARWSTPLNGTISYPIIADGRIFVTTGTSLSGHYGTSLYALDLSTGQVLWGPVAIAGTYFVSNLAYDHGTLFVVNFDGVLQSFDAATGTGGWSIQIPNQSDFAPPTAIGGVIYLAGSGDGPVVYAVDELNGNLLWQSGVSGGDGSSPTVSSDGVFVSYVCHVYKLDLITGAVDWHYSLGCTSGDGITSVYWNGLLFDRYVSPVNPPSLILNADTGQALGPFSAYTAPAFSATTGYFVVSRVLNAVDPSTQNVLWTFQGDGELSSSPVVIDNVVIVGSASGTVYAVNATTGQPLWSDVAGPTILYQDGTDATAPWTGLGAGEGYLVVPAGNVLTGYQLVP